MKCSTKGTFELLKQGIPGTVEACAKAPNKVASVVDIPGFGPVRQGFEGSEGWASNPQTPLRMLQSRSFPPRGAPLSSIKSSGCASFIPRSR